MEVREITELDLGDYVLLRRASEKEYPQYVGANVETELAAGKSGIEDLFSTYPSLGHNLLGIFDNGTLAGITSLTRKASDKYRHKAFLWGMYIYPKYRKQGASSQLMERSIEWAKLQNGLEAITLFVTSTNIKGINFYKRYGFECYGTERRHMFAAGAFHDAHLYELVL
ncbi:hypothetical protein A9Q81_03600 [Gammaproteobacteria bacterium 42_54_T18]|nr:hypothetical protein A9Q81_03600 [Gammaproteobacteria bacterium 42_54_T18]